MDSKGDQIVAQPVAPIENKTKLSSHHCEYAEYASTGATYFVFMMSVGVVLRHFSDRDFSTVLTLGAGLQCLGFFLLLQKVKRQRSVAGISSKMLEMYVLVILFRLSSTLIKQGYLPVDRSGDYVYQMADMMSLCLVFQLLWCCHKTHKVTFQADHDSLEIWRAVPVALVLATCFHGNLNKSTFFDTTWTVGMYLDTVAMLPQYWMLVKKGGEVEALTSHFVALVVLSRACSFAFWYYGHKELAPRANKNAGMINNATGLNIAGWLIVACHSTQLLMSADFMYHYVSSAMSKVKMVLPAGQACDV
jgi:hypothetical protein